MQLLVCASVPVRPAEFIEYWERGYSADPEGDDREYFAGIESLGRTDCPDSKRCLRALFTWKNGRNLSQAKEVFVERIWGVIERVGGVQAVRQMDPSELLGMLKERGLIWSLFLLHCLHPGEYPIFDMHVYRAMTFIQDGRASDLSGLSYNEQVSLYFNRYRAFWNSLCPHACDSRMRRKVDRAIWAFGKMLSTSHAFMIKETVLTHG